MVEVSGVLPALGVRAPRAVSPDGPVDSEEAPASRTLSKPVDREESRRTLRSERPILRPRDVSPARTPRSTLQEPVAGRALSTPSRFPRRESVFERLVSAVQGAPVPARARIRLDVRAEELGKLQIELSQQGRGLRGEVIVESDAARSAILSRLDELRSTLDRRGLRLAELEVTVAVPAPEEEGPAPRSERRQVLDVSA